MQITIRYGLTKLENITVDGDSTYGEIRSQYSSVLGLPESVDTYVDGNLAEEDNFPRDGDVLTFEKRACEKA